MRWFSTLVLICFGGFTCATPPRGSAQQPRTPRLNYAGQTSALDAIVTIGLQTQVPIGIVPGRDTTFLCKLQYLIDLRGMTASTALLDIARRTQYSLTEEDGVFILTAPDTTPRQTEVLDHMFKFKPGTNQTTHMLSFQLEGWLWTEVGHGEGYGGSILDNPDAQKITLPPMLRNLTTEQIANRIVSRGKRGIWISKISPDSAASLDDFLIEFESYGDQDQLKREISCSR